MALLLAWILLVTPGGRSPLAEASPQDALSLDAILLRLSRVATLYSDSALKFACDEKVTNAGFDGRTYRFAYIYVYDRERGFMDYRTGPGPRSRREVDLGRYRIPRFLRQAYSWAFVFGKSRQSVHRYSLLGRDTVLGREAVKLRFEPIPPYRENINDWFGTAWIDRETSQILRVEAQEPEQHFRQMEFEEELAGRQGVQRLTGRPYLIELVSTEFSVEQNGMRFPSRVIIEMKRYAIRDRTGKRKVKESSVYQVEQTYDHYRFFSVHSREEIRSRVSGGNP